MKTLKNKYPGKYTILGCGPSASNSQLAYTDYVIGVNDAAIQSGTHYQLDFHVVLDPEKSFAAERYKVIRNTESRILFTQLKRIATKADIVQNVAFYPDRGWIEPKDGVMPKSRQSPFVAAAIAIWMGATELHFCGVDLTDHKHIKGRVLLDVERHLRDLCKWCERNGIKVYNYGNGNILTGMPGVVDKMTKFEKTN